MRHFSDDDEYSEELLDKSTELWTGAAKKRQMAMQNLTPGYSRRQVEHPNQSFSAVMDQQLDSIKEKLHSQKSATKQKDFEIENLKARITQLNQDKQLLISSIQNDPHHHHHPHQQHERTINFEKTQTDQQRSRAKKHNKSLVDESIQEACKERLEDLSKEKLLELLRSTAEYKGFVDYHDSHELVFLNELHESSRRTIPCDKRGNQEWSQEQIAREMMRLSEKEKLGLSHYHQNAILGAVKEYYDRQFQQKARILRSQYEAKLKKTAKEASTIIPPDLKEICRVKEGQLAQQMNRKKAKSTLKKTYS